MRKRTNVKMTARRGLGKRMGKQKPYLVWIKNRSSKKIGGQIVKGKMKANMLKKRLQKKFQNSNVYLREYK